MGSSIPAMPQKFPQVTLIMPWCVLGYLMSENQQTTCRAHEKGRQVGAVSHNVSGNLFYVDLDLIRLIFRPQLKGSHQLPKAFLNFDSFDLLSRGDATQSWNLVENLVRILRSGNPAESKFLETNELGDIVHH